MAQPAPQPAPPTRAGLAPSYPWFAAGVCSWFGAWGMQQVLFTWIAVGDLGLSAEWVGRLQVFPLLPALILLPLGGVVADRVDARRLLVALHAVATIPVLLLSLGLATGSVGLAALMVFGLTSGTLNAFVMPSRDSLLSRVAGGDMMRAVTGATIAQFGSQGAGTLLAGLSRWFGAPVMLVAQSVVLLVGALVNTRIPDAPAGDVRAPQTAARPGLGELTEGARFVLGGPLRGVMVLLFGVGTLFIGPFLVCFPILVRDYYGGDAFQLSLVLMLFPLGTITGSLLLLWRGGIRRKGLALLGALSVGGSMLVVIGQGLPFWGFLLATLCWGMGAAVFMNSSRTLFQEAAPPALRARVLAVFQLGFMGAGPVGSLAAGAISERLGPLPTLVGFGCAMLTLIACVATFTRVRKLA